MFKNIYNWSKEERKLLKRFNTVLDIQLFLDSTKYNNSKKTLMPGQVLRVSKANCFDGAIFAASVFDYLGLPPLLMDLRAVRDDDHVLAVFKVDGCYGAVAKSNFTGLRYREPIYKSIRELAVSYFNDYFNYQRERTLREYSRVLDLRKVLKSNWYNDPDFFYHFSFVIDNIKHYPVISKRMITKLALVDKRTFQAGKYGKESH